MEKPKTVKSFLKMCIAICEMNRDELKGIENLTEKEYEELGNIRAGMQNDIGENHKLLNKYNLKVDNGSLHNQTI